MIESIFEQSSARAHTARRRRRALVPAVVAAAALMGALVTGCSSSDSGSSSTTSAGAPATGPLPDGAQLIAESSRTTQTLQSVHLDLQVTNIPNLPVDYVKADITNQPQGSGQALGEAKVRVKENDPTWTETKFLVVDKTLYAGDGTKYAPVGPAEKIYDPGVILDKDKGIAHVIAEVQNPKAEARETIDGVNTVKVTGTIDTAVIDPVVPRIGQTAGVLPITLWIADVAPPTTSASALPSSAASPGTGPNLVRAVVTKDAGNVNLTLSGWGKPVTVAKPAG
ncbi:LppX_LprAFG lipoprotein [Nocardia sp. NBC_01327]|uniref:LppX_LprAFG lipoprotein n=1 Tax=Nocardia sp. NBC_01327 TaxID=2903593 RepID=UPI002E1525F0|nr:LppX_LprAFG lipoprotein [Nocardia sp. NBC_01327]